MSAAAYYTSAVVVAALLRLQGYQPSAGAGGFLLEANRKEVRR